MNPQSLDVICFYALYHDAAAGSSWALRLMLAFTTVGGGWGALLVLPMLVRRRTRALASSLAATFLVTAGFVFVLKPLVARVRPCWALAGVHPWISKPTDFSFPSGHAAGSFSCAAFFVTLLVARVREGRAQGPGSQRAGWAPEALGCAALIAAAACVAVSRVYLGVHYPGDIAAGAALGSTLGWAGARQHRRRFAVGQK